MLWRWTLDTATGAVTEEQRSDIPLEFPRVDERLVGRPHRVGYASEVRSSGPRSTSAAGSSTSTATRSARSTSGPDGCPESG